MDFLNASLKFESQISGYKQVAHLSLKIFGFGNKARVLLLISYVLYKRKLQSNVAFFC